MSDNPLVDSLAGLRDGLEQVIGQVRLTEQLQELLRGVARASHVLLTDTNVDRAVDQAIAAIGNSAGFDTISVVKRVRRSGTNIFERYTQWSRGGEHPARSIAIDDVALDLEALRRGEAVHTRAADQPDQIRDYMLERGLASVLFVPIIGEAVGAENVDGTNDRDGNDWWGILVFGASDASRHWSDAEFSVIKTIAAGIGGALSRHRAMQRELELQRELLEARQLESLGLLARGVAHDMNNVLQSLHYHMELVARNAQLAAAGAESLDAARKNTERAARLIKQLRQYAGQSAPQHQSVDVGIVVREAVEFVRPMLKPGVEVNVEIPDRLPPVSGDPTQLDQVVTNLLVNAGEVLADDGGTITVRALPITRNGAGGPRDYVAVDVVDCGPGMDAATCARVFDPFYSTKGKGRGLGLAAVAGIVRSHNGSIEVDSVHGEGTTFHVFLPVKTA